MADYTPTGVPVTRSKPASAEIRNEFGAIATAIMSKQDALVSGTSIKTIAGQSILGSGNIALTGSDIGRVVEDLATVRNITAADKGKILRFTGTNGICDLLQTGGWNVGDTFVMVKANSNATNLYLRAGSNVQLWFWNTTTDNLGQYNYRGLLKEWTSFTVAYQGTNGLGNLVFKFSGEESNATAI